MNADSYSVWRACLVLSGGGARGETISAATREVLFRRGLAFGDALTLRRPPARGRGSRGLALGGVPPRGAVGARRLTLVDSSSQLDGGPDDPDRSSP